MDVSQGGVADVVNLTVDLSLTLLEDLDFAVDRVALFAAEFNERFTAS